MKTTTKFTYKSMINSLKYAILLLFRCKIKGHNLHLSLSRNEGPPHFLQYLAYNTPQKKKKIRIYILQITNIVTTFKQVYITS